MQQGGKCIPSSRVVQSPTDSPGKAKDTCNLLCMQHGSALALAESLTAHSTVWRRLPLHRAGQHLLHPGDLTTPHLLG